MDLASIQKQIRWLFEQVQCLTDAEPILFLPTKLSFNTANGLLSVTFVDGSIQTVTIPRPILHETASTYNTENGILTTKFTDGSTRITAIPIPELPTVFETSISYDTISGILTAIFPDGSTKTTEIKMPDIPELPELTATNVTYSHETYQTVAQALDALFIMEPEPIAIGTVGTLALFDTENTLTNSPISVNEAGDIVINTNLIVNGTINYPIAGYTDNRGLAAFDSNYFTVSDGNVTIKAENFISNETDPIFTEWLTNVFEPGGTGAIELQNDVVGTGGAIIDTTVNSIQGIIITKDGVDTLVFEGNIAVTGEVLAWANAGSNIGTVFENIPHAGYTDAFGIASFDPTYFALNNGYVSIVPSSIIAAETDPIFTSSPAFNITVEDIINWNSPVSLTTDDVPEGTIEDRLYVDSIERGILSILKQFGFSVPSPGILMLDASFFTTGDLQAWTDNGSLDLPTIWESIPKAAIYVDENSFGVTAFNGAHFSMDINNVVSIRLENIVTEEIDPIFSASPAFGISTQNINEWNAFLTNNFLLHNENITLSGDVTGFHNTEIETTVEKIRGISVTKVDGVDVLLFHGSIAATGDIQAWSSDGTGIPQSLLDALPIASYNTLEARGLAAFNSEQFTVIDGIVSLIPITSGTFNHSEMNELDYANSGHTGFQPTLEVPIAPTSLVLTEEAEYVQVEFSLSVIPDKVEIWASQISAVESFELIGVIVSPSSSETLKDYSYLSSGTVYYKIYAIKYGIYSVPLTGNITTIYMLGNLTNVILNEDFNTFRLQWENPGDRRFKEVEIYYDAQEIEANLSETQAIVNGVQYTGNDESFEYEIKAGDEDKFHQFWIKTLTR